MARENKADKAETLWRTAVHEAGHAVYAWFSDCFITVRKVTIRPGKNSLGETFDDRRPTKTRRSDIIDDIASYLAGMVAEELLGLKRAACYDLDAATYLATDLVQEQGMGRRVGLRHVDEDTIVSDWLRSLIDRDIRDAMNEAYRLARKSLARRKSAIRAVAQCLMEHQTINTKDLERLLGPKV